MVSFQKRLAAKILNVGKDKIWIDKSRLEDIKKAITRKDIKNLIKKGYIKKLSPKVKFPYKEETKRVKKGHSISKKEVWVKSVRALRKTLKELKENQKIDKKTYKTVYKWIKGGMFKSRRHMLLFLKQRGMIKE